MRLDGNKSYSYQGLVQAFAQTNPNSKNMETNPSSEKSRVSLDVPETTVHGTGPIWNRDVDD